MDLSALAVSISLGVQGAPATYTSPTGDAVECRVLQHQGDIRRDTANRIRFGNVLEVWREGVSFDVAASDLPSPAPGGVVALEGGASYMITGVPTRRDPARLIWTLDCSFGMPIIFRAVSMVAGQPETQNPPVCQGLKLASAVPLGSNVIDVVTDYAFVGRILPGDVLTIGGVDYTVTNETLASGRVASGVRLTPPLVAPADAGDLVSARWSRDVAVHAGVSAYADEEIAGKVQLGDMRILLMRDLLTAAGFTGDPTVTDLVVINGSTWVVLDVIRLMQGNSVLCYEIHVRGNG